jgi:glucose/arabinose dehydrogenase
MSRLLTVCRRVTPFGCCSLLVSGAMVWVPVAAALESDVVASGFNRPVFLTAPIGDPRLFVVERSGTIKIVENGALGGTFLDISGQVTSDSGERGLLGLAFDPNYATNHRFYVDYIDNTSSHNTVIASYVANGNATVPGSQKIILTIPQTTESNHKAGWIGFRPGEANNLYIATGDGGGSNDQFHNGQNPQSLLGKMLRIDVNQPVNGPPYTIPAGNASGGAPEIWASGLRNPYRDSFDRANGNFYIADVGQGTREEIDLVPAGTDPTHPGGANFGWPVREGKTDGPQALPPGAKLSDYTDPIYDYAHGGGTFEGDAIIGGYVYRGAAMPGLDGTYFFGDYINGKIWSVRVNPDGSFIAGTLTDRTAELLGTHGIGALTSFGEDGFGNLYIVDYGSNNLRATDGRIFALVPEPSTFALFAAALIMLFWFSLRRSGR